MRCIAIVAVLIYLGLEFTESRFFGLNDAGKTYFKNLCKMQDPNGPMNTKPLVCHFLNFVNATTTTTTIKPVFVCTGPNTGVLPCPGRPIEEVPIEAVSPLMFTDLCPPSYDLEMKVVRQERCVIDSIVGPPFTTTTPRPTTMYVTKMPNETVPVNPPPPPPPSNIKYKYSCKGLFMCDMRTMTCPGSMSTFNQMATCTALRI